MAITIDLDPQTEERLSQEAARQGLDPGEYLPRLIERELPTRHPEGASLWETLSAEEWKREFHAWIGPHADITAPVIPLELLRREHLYEERD